MLGLDPLRDQDDFAAYRALRDEAGEAGRRLSPLLARAERSADPRMHRLATRIRNVGAPDWPVWADEHDATVLEVLPPDFRVAVIDLGRSESAQDRAVRSAATLEWLWRNRHERVPRLIVIDEAHNVCPQVPADPIQAMGTEHVIRIAAEGRKYGLYLLLSTQQPQKIHANVLAQCDNLILLRLNSAEGARQVLNAVESMQSQALIKVHDAAMVNWPEDKKKPKTEQLHNVTSAGAWSGAFWGMLFGILFFVPLLGAAVGAAMGAVTGSLADVGIDDDFINRVRDEVTPGTSALFLLTSDAVLDRVRDGLKQFDFEILTTNLSAEEEQKLREAFEHGDEE